MFIGKAYHQIDDKGRIRMPVKFKEQLGPTPVIMQAPDNVLRVYSYSVAESIFNSLSESADITDLNANDAQTLVSGNSEIVEEDKQGRLLTRNLSRTLPSWVLSITSRSGICKSGSNTLRSLNRKSRSRNFGGRNDVSHPRFAFREYFGSRR